MWSSVAIFCSGFPEKINQTGPISNFPSFLDVFLPLLIHYKLEQNTNESWTASAPTAPTVPGAWRPWRGEAGAQVALLTGSSPPEACEEHFRERILVLHQKKYQL